jgi:CRP/FNR family transcriptional regulator, cyclic AMP receptor protein
MDTAKNPPAAPGKPDPYLLFQPPLAALAAQGAIKRYKRGLILIQEGDPGGDMYFVLAGRLRTYTANEDGDEFTFGFYGAGETLGEMSLDGGTRSASVVVEEAAVCAHVDRATLKAGIAQDPELAFELMGLLIRRARMLSDRARDLALTDVYGRLSLLLRASARQQPDGTLRLPYPLTQLQMSQVIGCARPMVSKLMKDLVQGGYLRQDSTERGRLWTIVRPLPSGY